MNATNKTTSHAREIEFAITNGTFSVNGVTLRSELVEAMCLDITDEDRACGVIFAEIDFDLELEVRPGRSGRAVREQALQLGWELPEDLYHDEPIEVLILKVSIGTVVLTWREEELLLGGNEGIDEIYDCLQEEAEWEARAKARAAV
jgi:hypothetical protein